MDPTSLLIAGGMYIVAEISRKASDEAVEAVWTFLRAAWKRQFGRDPAPLEIDVRQVELLGKSDPALETRIAAFWEGSPLLRRAQRAEPVLRTARILWVDDHPEWNRVERQFLEAFGLRIVTVETTRSALAFVRGEPFDLIVSDIARGENTCEGIDALPALRSAAPDIPAIFYLMDVREDGPPRGAFGITNRPSDLLSPVYRCA